MKMVEVPDDWCEDCSGTGKRTLHGIAITSNDFNTWSDDERGSYLDGEYDTMCEVCLGTGSIDPKDAQAHYEMQAMLKAEAPHLFQ